MTHDPDSPDFLPRGELYRRARQVEELARIIQDCTRATGGNDTTRAARLFAQIAALAGPPAHHAPQTELPLS